MRAKLFQPALLCFSSFLLKKSGGLTFFCQQMNVKDNNTLCVKGVSAVLAKESQPSVRGRKLAGIRHHPVPLRARKAFVRAPPSPCTSIVAYNHATTAKATAHTDMFLLLHRPRSCKHAITYALFHLKKLK